jgi:hypothetical protein
VAKADAAVVATIVVVVAKRDATKRVALVAINNNKYV